MKKKKLNQPDSALLNKLHLSTEDTPFLMQALTHRSYVHEAGGESNERLEFLGDSVLSLVISEYIYTKFPQKTEGELSKWRSSLVNAHTLAKIASALNLGKWLLLGTGEERTGGRSRESLLADTMEAIIAVVYLSQGLEQTRDFVIPLWQPLLEKLIHGNKPLDPKTMLQETLQHKKGELPVYNLLGVEGPDHKRQYTMGVYYKNIRIGVGKGKSKKEATKNAALQGLEYIKNSDTEKIKNNTKYN